MNVLITRGSFSVMVFALATMLVSPIAFGQVLYESAKLLPSDGAANDFFGGSVSLSGDVAVVSAHEDDDNGLQSGSAYVFRWNGSSWIQESKLLPLDGAPNDLFGCSVSVSGDVVVTGAYSDGDNGPASGSAYVFRYDASETICGLEWCEEQKLLASDGTTNAWFGWVVSVSGDVAFVGAIQQQSTAGPTAAYVFRHDPSEETCGLKWCEEQKLQPSDGAEYGAFGSAVYVSGDVAVVGARWDDVNGTDSGSAYVFRWNGSSWVQEQKLLASDGTANDWFGGTVSMSGDVAVVGADLDDDNGNESGSAYVFRWNGSSWVQEQKLLPSDGVAGDAFGWVVSVSGDVAVVGAGLDDDNGSESGSAYVFRYDASETICGQKWCQEQKLLASDGSVGDQFGVGNCVSGNLAVVGARQDDDNGNDSGSAYVFDLTADPIPAVSTWGLIVMSLLVLTAGTLVYARRRPIHA